LHCCISRRKSFTSSLVTCRLVLPARCCLPAYRNLLLHL
jgi:hypothetical protein